MKQEKLMDSMGYLPDDLLEETENARSNPIRIHRNAHRVLLRVVLAAALTVLMALGGLAAYQRWHMPEKLSGFQGNGFEIHAVTTYPAATQTVLPTLAETVPKETAPEQRSDEWFIAQAREVLALIQQEEPPAAKLQVTRQRNLWWSREEVEVSWYQEDQVGPTVKFDAETGYLIGISSFPQADEDGTQMSDEEALRLAESYYEKLPYAQGYTYRHVEKITDWDWMYYFDRPITVEIGGETMTLQSSYEQVRIVVNPCSGAFKLSNCFYVPLLDDHEPEELPLTKEQALEKANQPKYLVQPVDCYELEAEIGICLPRPESMAYYNGTDAEDENYPYSDVTRLGWILTFKDPPDADLMFPGETTICVDLYTGEILSVDTTG